jgi:DNA polymerase delta subunit 3
MYSLAPGPQRDVSLLYDVAKSLAEYTSKEDPLTAGEKYGTIRNLNVRRRDRQARPKPGSYTTSQPTKAQPIVPVKSEPSAAKKPSPFEVAAAAAKLKKQPSSQTPSSSETPTSSAAKPTPALKRGGSGSIMQSFAKAKPPKPKPEPKKEEDTEMALSDDGEADDEDIAKEKAEYKDSDAVRKSRKQREEELRRMMEDDDEEEKSEEEPADEEMEEAPEPEPEPEEEPKEKEEEPAETTTTITNGRRRGKRKVMKKERVMDEQGYLGKRRSQPHLENSINKHQLRYKSPAGSHFQKTKLLRPRNPQSPHPIHLPPPHQQGKPRNPPERAHRGTSCPSSPKSHSISLEAHCEKSVVILL